MRVLVILTALLCTLVEVSTGGVHVLRADGSGDYATIQAAINAASSGDVIALQRGDYSGPGNRNIDFLGKAVTVTSLAGAELTVVDCGGAGQGFVFESGEGPGSMLVDITVKNANGYGIVCDDGSPTIISCVVRDCEDGVQIGFDADPRLVHCIISSNLGDGIRTGFSSSGNLVSCYVESNLESGIDGNSCGLDISGGYIRGNADGGLHAYNNAFFDMVGVVVTGNQSPDWGGGIYCDEGGFSIRNTTIASNHARNGGGLYVSFDANVDCEDTIIWDNCADVDGDEIYLQSLAFPLEVDCSDVDASGIYGDPSDYVITNPLDADPRFCDPEPCTNAATPWGNYRLASDSPCLPGASPCGRQIGALGVGCAMPVSGTPETNGASSSSSLLHLREPRPNPASGEMAFEIEVAQAGRVRLEIVDARGRVCTTLVDEVVSGAKTAVWDGTLAGGRRAASGVYFARLTGGGTSEIRRAIVVN